MEVRLVFRVTQAAVLAEGIPVGKAERIGKRRILAGRVIVLINQLSALV
jgi:hypothetical protein